MATLEEIRAVVEKETGPLENEWIVNWCNDCNADIESLIFIPSTTYQITINTTDTEYPLPADLKEINRLWLQSDFDNGINRELKVDYRIYGGKIQFPRPFPFVDTLNVDYYKYLTVFSDITDSIELHDRFVPLYTSYCVGRYYALFKTQQEIGELMARRNYERAAVAYNSTKMQVVQTYGFTNPDLSIRERW